MGKSYLRQLLCFFLVMESIIYLLFLFFDFNGYTINSSYLKFSGLIIIVLYSFTYYKNWDLKHLLYRIALIGTLNADYFLLLLDECYECGISIFIFVQIIYFLIIHQRSSMKGYLLSLGIRVVLIVSSIIILKTFDFGICDSLLHELAVIYFLNLLINAIESFYYHKKGTVHIFLAIGLVLFVLCDLTVAIYNLTTDSQILYKISEILMWLFYFPSQVLIVLSLDYDKIMVK